MGGDTRQRMRAVVAKRRGGPEVLELAEVPRPSPKPGEVLVRVHAAGVNASDRHLRRSPFHLPLLRLLGRAPVAGLELAGVVAERGPGATRFEVGEEVYGALPGSLDGGTYAEFVRMREDWLGRKPRNVSFEEAAGLPVGGMTALQMLRDKARITQGQRVLVNGASGAVGMVAVQLAKAKGCEVVGACSTGNVELVRSLGAGRVVDYKREHVRTAGTFDVLFDAVGVLQRPDVVALLRPGGAWITTVPRPDSFADLMYYRRHGLRAFVAMVRPSASDLAELAAQVEAGALRIPIDQVLPLGEAAKAQARLESGHPRGRLVLKVAG
ncbi:MAG TPA: NAD(P)-dependent alcohol dehydrogenase [Myxococcaceae bacterium]|nr:NAD(P)-dependent alcohol dehydrogenase [Myxococcaceae bacterium]